MITKEKKAPDQKSARNGEIKYTYRQRIAIDKLKRGLSDNIGQLNVGKAMREAGYSEITSKTPKRLTESKAYKAEILPLITRLERARDRAIERMSKTIDKATYRDTAYSVDILTKNLQLLTGGATENQLVINISKEIADKNKLEPETTP